MLPLNDMKRSHYITGAVIILIAGALLYYRAFLLSPTERKADGNTNANSGTPPGSLIEATMISGPIPASSYGSGAVGTKDITSVTLPGSVSSNELGTLIGTAKPAQGTKPNFSAMKVALYDPKTQKLLASMTPNADGFYKFIVQPGEYVLNLMPGSGSSAQLPLRLYIAKGQVSNVNFFVK